MNKKNTFQANSKYFTISIYTILTVLAIVLIIRAVFFWDSTAAFINNLFSTLSPFIIGILIAFLISPLVNWVRTTVLSKWFRIKNRGLSNILAILISYFVVFTIITLGIIYIVPEIIESLNMLLEKLPDWANAVMDFVNKISERNPNLQLDFVKKAITSADSTLQSFLADFIANLTTTIVSTGVSIIKFVFNFIVAIIVSCYLLLDKKMQARGIKRIIYAFFKKQHADRICKIIRQSIRTFSNFFDGKMIDSLIIGILTFVCMIIISFFDVPGFSNCAFLVGVIVGVTNMIPYFGPFLGGVPCALLLCIYSTKSALVFGILIIIIQQLDGNIIGPKILGQSTGLRPLWIIFAITIGGWIGGVVGMFLGVPCVAVLSGLLEELVNERLKEKNIDLPVLKNEKVRKNKSSNQKELQNK